MPRNTRIHLHFDEASNRGYDNQHQTLPDQSEQASHVKRIYLRAINGKAAQSARTRVMIHDYRGRLPRQTWIGQRTEICSCGNNEVNKQRTNHLRVEHGPTDRNSSPNSPRRSPPQHMQHLCLHISLTTPQDDRCSSTNATFRSCAEPTLGELANTLFQFKDQQLTWSFKGMPCSQKRSHRKRRCGRITS